MFLGSTRGSTTAPARSTRSVSLHTVIIEGDVPRVSLVWHSAAPCHFKVQKLERTIVTLKTELTSGGPVAEPEELELA